MSGEVNTGNKPGEVADFDKPLEPSAVASSAQPAPEPRGVALLGARQDLTLSGSGQLSCKCLAVALGQPGDSAFHWSGERPKTDPATELVIAFGSAGVACPEAGEKSMGPSYWGYEVVGNDVVVVVENAAPGRPVTSGAIIPRPLGNGGVYLQPSDKKVPYGKAATGSGLRCPLGKPPVPVNAPAPTSAPPNSTPLPQSGVRIQSNEAPMTSKQTGLP